MVLKLGISASYVLDNMAFYEAKSLMSFQYYKAMETWEQTRFIGYLIAQSNSTKRLKISDILTFEWDENVKNESRKGEMMTDTELTRLKQKAAQWINNL